MLHDVKENLLRVNETIQNLKIEKIRKKQMEILDLK